MSNFLPLNPYINCVSTESKAEKYRDEMRLLFKEWKDCHGEVCIPAKQGSQELAIDHRENVFITDGVVDPCIWFSQGIRPLFLLKEAYGSDRDWSLIDHLTQKGSADKMWRRVSEWTCGLMTIGSDPNHEMVQYDPGLPVTEYNNEFLQKSAVINVKKSGGEKESNMDIIRGYATFDKERLYKQIQLCDPTVIVCGYTASALDIIAPEPIRKEKDNRLFYRMELNGHEVIVLDFWHPANQYPDVMNFYGLMGIYQSACKQYGSIFNNFKFLYSDIEDIRGIETAVSVEAEHALYTKYGKNPDPAILDRFYQEWKAILENYSTLLDIAVLHEFSLWLKANRLPHWMPGAAGSSFILYLLGITQTNPLPPHYICPRCGKVVWNTDCIDGFDLHEDIYDECDIAYQADGHDIPWQTLWGYGDEPAKLNLRIPRFLGHSVRSFLEKHWLRNKAFCIYTDNFVRTSYDGFNHSIFNFSNIAFSCTIQVDETYKGIFPEFINAVNCFLFEVIGNHDLITNCGDERLDYMSTPSSFSELVYYNGLLNGNGTWDDDVLYMIDELGFSPTDMIAFEDDVFKYLVRHGFLEKDAWREAHALAKRNINNTHGLSIVTDEMLSARDKWILPRCEKIKYLFPKARSVEYIMYYMKYIVNWDNLRYMNPGSLIP